MKIIIKIKMLSALFAVLVFNACERRLLEDAYIETAVVQLHIDWSESGVSVDDMHRASIWLFPQNNGAALEFRLEGNLIYREINVPIGVYSVLVFNETIDKDDWNNIIFTGTDSYETFAAMNVPKSEMGFYSRTKDLPLIGNPEAIAAWSLDRFEIMSKKSDIIEIKPLPRFERVAVTAYVSNLSGSMQATGTINGMQGGVYMASGNRIAEPSAHSFILNGRVYDDNGKDGTTTRTFNIFGRLEEANHKIAIDFLLSNGTLHPSEEFDVNNLIVTETVEYVRTHFVNLGYGNLPDDRPITLPEGDMNAGIIVDEWENVIIPIK